MKALLLVILFFFSNQSCTSDKAGGSGPDDMQGQSDASKDQTSDSNTKPNDMSEVDALNNEQDSNSTTPPRQPTLRFDGGFEKGNVEPWELNMKQGKPIEYQFTIVDKNEDPKLVRQGRYSARTVVHDGDEFLNTGGERCDLEFPENAQREVEGDDLWYAFSTLFPENWKPLDRSNNEDWMVILDWHSTYWIDTDFDPCQHLQFELDGTDQVGIRMLTGNVNGYDCYSPPSNGEETAYQFSKNLFKIRPGVWNDFVIHVEWTTGDGVVEVWHKFADQKYEKVVDLHNIPTLQHIGDPTSVESPYLILAHYRSADQSDTKTLYHDGFRIAQSAEDLIEGNLYDLKK